jgi:hypothetical protein
MILGRETNRQISGYWRGEGRLSRDFRCSPFLQEGAYESFNPAPRRRALDFTGPDVGCLPHDQSASVSIDTLDSRNLIPVSPADTQNVSS